MTFELFLNHFAQSAELKVQAPLPTFELVAY